MRTFAVLFANLVVALVVLLAAQPALAQHETYVTFVSKGDSSTPCASDIPCGAFDFAQTLTVEGGEIHCLNSGRIGGATITKSITIDCASSSNVTDGIIVDAPGKVVTIRNLRFNGVFGNGTGIEFRNGAALLVENCVIENYNTSASYVGIKFRPSAPGAKLVVTDTVLRNNGTGSTGGGIVVSPQPGGSAQVVLTRVSVDKNVFGIVADGTGSTGGINMTITDSVSSGNLKDGLIATTPAGGAPIGVMVTNTKSVNNSFGIRSIGPHVTVRVDNSKIVGNGTGLGFSGGGALQSYGNNSVDANATNGAFSGPIPLK